MGTFARLTVIATVAFGISGWAGAQGGDGAYSRSQVQAEMFAERSSGRMAALHGEDSGSAWLSGHAGSTAGRSDAVKAAASEGDRALFAALIAEDSGSAYLSATAKPSGLTRSQVLADAAAARSKGEIHAMVGEDSGAAFLARQRAWKEALYAGPDVGKDADETAAATTG